MKILINRIIIAFFLVSLIFIGCEEADSEKPFGIEVVYIPQSITSGGTDLNYIVPSGFNNSANFKVDEAANKVNILLGVAKSGKAVTQAFSVDVTTRVDTLTQLRTGGATFEILPSSAYVLPTKVSLAAEQNSASFNLSIDKTILKTYAGKKVAVCVVISNQTNPTYVLSAKNKQVIVIIDVNALRL